MSKIKTDDAPGPIVASDAPSGEIATLTRLVGNAVARYFTGRYPPSASYTHTFPSLPAVTIREPSGVNVTSTTAPLCWRCSARSDVLATSKTRERPLVNPHANARLPSVFEPEESPPRAGRYATHRADSPGASNSYSCSPVTTSQTRTVGHSIQNSSSVS